MSQLATREGRGIQIQPFIDAVASEPNIPHPDPVWGYAHGPIENNNPGWLPPEARVPRQPRAGPYQIKAKDISNDPAHPTRAPPNPRVTISKENTGVCDIIRYGQTICGQVFEDQGAFRRHIRQEHAGAALMPTKKAKDIDEITAGRNAIMRWVITGGWRDAVYVFEPGRGPDTNLIGHFCDGLERIAEAVSIDTRSLLPPTQHIPHAGMALLHLYQRYPLPWANTTRCDEDYQALQHQALQHQQSNLFFLRATLAKRAADAESAARIAREQARAAINTAADQRAAVTDAERVEAAQARDAQMAILVQQRITRDSRVIKSMMEWLKAAEFAEERDKLAATAAAEAITARATTTANPADVNAQSASAIADTNAADLQATATRERLVATTRHTTMLELLTKRRNLIYTYSELRARFHPTGYRNGLTLHQLRQLLARDLHIVRSSMDERDRNRLNYLLMTIDQLMRPFNGLTLDDILNLSTTSLEYRNWRAELLTMVDDDARFRYVVTSEDLPAEFFDEFLNYDMVNMSEELPPSTPSPEATVLHIPR
ncbi:hypothetical protein N7466_009424 [Penicillium verhagenii]|uniref:uncharacterized protein n=1 Tax=Penicillium verhagenii TaxID=1562060 RepID=UPI00254517AE|nr:uncharacterized protein N7466_009424 [Penicillium verhagenii]KAJ5921098.1 hypothetical protein N7466_009424 [Penicillium verhagenii]